MSEDPTEAPRRPLTAQDRDCLRNDAIRTMRLLSEALDQPDQDPDSAADAALLVARLQAAVEPLRASVAVVSASAVGTGALTTGRPTLSGSGTVAVHHVIHIQDQVAVLDSATVTVTPHEPTVTGRLERTLPPDTGSATGTVTWTGTAHGEAPPETFQVTADDVPWILWQVLLRLDDMANPTKPGITVGQVYDRLLPLLSLLVALLPYLT
jgi:hypothetical protein